MQKCVTLIIGKNIGKKDERQEKGIAFFCVLCIV